MWHRSFISPDTTLGSHVFWSIKSATAKTAEKLICFVQMIEAIALVGEMGLPVYLL
jgi:hypothetical protein